VTRFVNPMAGSPTEPTHNPERLTEGKFGRLLKDGNRELADGLDQSAAFRRLTQRMSMSHVGVGSRHGYWLAPATGIALAVFAVLPAVVRRMHSRPATLIAAEGLRGHQEERVASTAALPEGSAPRTAPQTTRPTDGRSASAVKRNGHGPNPGASVAGTSSPVLPRAVPAPEPQPPGTPEPSDSVTANPALANAAPASDVGAAPDCLSLARRGQTRDAETCFLKRAEGSGLGAEMALYEAARLRRDVLGDAAGALRALAEYRTRFPSGSLRREADMSQLELLVQLGRTDEALKQSDELLSSSASGERAAELHLLRGHILRKTRSRFAEAAHEYELAENAGARGGDVTYFRALCLEALGRGPEAAALFTQYLEQPPHSYANDARRRLERLKP